MENAVKQQIQNLFTGTDERNWPKVAAAMNDTVLLDYSSMNSSPASELTPAQIINAWSSVLPGFDKTHHKLSNFKIRIAGSKASAHFDGDADHFIGKELWNVKGSYDVSLILKNDEWKVESFKFNFAEQNGNLSLPEEAVKRVQGKG